MKYEHVCTNSDRQTIIRVAGLPAPVTLLHLTDSHMNASDLTEGVEALAESIRLYNFDALDTQTRFDRALAYANDLQADAVVLTGDIVNGATAGNLSLLDKRLSSLRVPYLYTPGNHDWEYPGRSWGEATRAEQYPKFEPLMAGDPSFQTLEIGGIQLVAVDNSTYQISEAQLAAFEQALSRGLPTLLFMHIPIYVPSLLPDVVRVWGSPIMMAAQGWDANLMKQWQVEPAGMETLAFYELLMDNPQGNLIGVFCGHVHFAHDDAFGRGSRQYVTAAGLDGGYRVIRLLPARESDGPAETAVHA
ncbi:metallophosphoesterase family protein [Cohnella rhizosphaerae]|uniref:Metallophosphoesterase n=1 Tax=Cohnella rhizosphaerae TaxID=1457232 RepID=A0A9X4KYQ9_9BACL|nr:metallophosphoesterase [Cohnella rhizosphaerae]MDG0813801.1 metallophosphoesterase [Cohnella rhizosphaerae]